MALTPGGDQPVAERCVPGITGRIKLRAAASRAFRLPSYTELYYSDPADLGNPNLKPESATSYEGGADAYVRTNLHASVTVFQRRDTNVIDYVRANPSALWQATNFDKLHLTGVEAATVWAPRTGQQISLTFSALRGVNASDQQILESKYTFNYPVHSAVVAWNGTIWKNFVARTRLGVLDRLDQSAYALWDVSAGYTAGRVRPFLQLSNLSQHFVSGDCRRLDARPLCCGRRRVLRLRRQSLSPDHSGFCQPQYPCNLPPEFVSIAFGNCIDHSQPHFRQSTKSRRVKCSAKGIEPCNIAVITFYILLARRSLHEAGAEDIRLPEQPQQGIFSFALDACPSYSSAFAAVGSRSGYVAESHLWI